MCIRDRSYIGCRTTGNAVIAFGLHACRCRWWPQLSYWPFSSLTSSSRRKCNRSSISNSKQNRFGFSPPSDAVRTDGRTALRYCQNDNPHPARFRHLYPEAEAFGNIRFSPRGEKTVCHPFRTYTFKKPNEKPWLAPTLQRRASQSRIYTTIWQSNPVNPRRRNREKRARIDISSPRFQVFFQTTWGSELYEMRTKKVFFQPNDFSFDWDWCPFLLNKDKNQAWFAKKCIQNLLLNCTDGRKKKICLFI